MSCSPPAQSSPSVHFRLNPLITAVLLFPVSAFATEAVDPAAATATLRFSPANLVFNAVALGESKPLTAKLTNASSVDVTLQSTTLSGAQASEFNQTSDCPSTLTAGKSCTFTLTFKPSAFKLRSAQLNVATDSAATPNLALSVQGNPYGALNDTGITTCSDANSNGLPCPVADFPRQDAEVGRDKTVNNDADGHAGFNFTKLDADGKDLPASATDWNCVRDNLTGLIWEKKPVPDGTQGNQGLHDADDTFTWYNTNKRSNGGDNGYPDESRNCSGYQTGKAASYCNTQAYVQRVNKTGWCGAKNWRMPTVKELEGLVDASIAYPGPTLDTTYFNEVSSATPWFWAASPYAGSSYYAWQVYFDNGSSDYGLRYFYRAVRLVRSGQ